MLITKAISHDLWTVYYIRLEIIYKIDSSSSRRRWCWWRRRRVSCQLANIASSNDWIFTLAYPSYAASPVRSCWPVVRCIVRIGTHTQVQCSETSAYFLWLIHHFGRSTRDIPPLPDDSLSAILRLFLPNGNCVMRQLQQTAISSSNRIILLVVAYHELSVHHVTRW